MIRAWFVIKYEGVVCCFMQNKLVKKKGKRRNGRGGEGGYLSSYNLNITDGFPNKN